MRGTRIHMVICHDSWQLANPTIPWTMPPSCRSRRRRLPQPCGKNSPWSIATKALSLKSTCSASFRQPITQRMKTCALTFPPWTHCVNASAKLVLQSAMFNLIPISAPLSPSPHATNPYWQPWVPLPDRPSPHFQAMTSSGILLKRQILLNLRQVSIRLMQLWPLPMADWIKACPRRARARTEERGKGQHVRATPKPASSMAHSTVTRALVLRWAEWVSSVDQSISISTHQYKPQLESVYHAPIWTATGIRYVLDMSDHKGFGEAEPWSQDGDLRLESEVREETRCISLGQA